MSDTTPVADSAWAALATVRADDRVAAMTGRLQSLVEADDAARQSALSAILAAEAGLSDEEVATMTVDRLRAMTALGVDDARSLAASLAEAERALPAAVSMKRIPLTQRACKGLSLEEVSHIEPFMPAVRQYAGIPGGASPASTPATASGPEPETPTQKRGLLGKLFGRP